MHIRRVDHYGATGNHSKVISTLNERFSRRMVEALGVFAEVSSGNVAKEGCLP